MVCWEHCGGLDGWRNGSCRYIGASLMIILTMPTATAVSNYGIQEVWQSNLEEEFRKIRSIVQKYPYVAMVRNYYSAVHCIIYYHDYIIL